MSQSSFAEVLSKFIERTRPRHSVRSLSKHSAEFFGTDQKIPHSTIHRWVQGYVKRPRTWHDIVKLGILLELSHTEMDLLLAAGRYPYFIDIKEDSQRVNEQSQDKFSQKLITLAEESMVDDQIKKNKPFQVPRDSSYYINRSEHMKELSRAIMSEQGPSLVTIQGMMGVGKTAFVKQLCYQLRPHFTDGILWAQLDQSKPKFILRQFINAYSTEALGDDELEQDLYTLSSQVRTILADKHILIILDGVHRDSDVRAMLPPTGKSVVLITTRRRDLAVSDGGTRVHLSPFTVDESLSLFSQILAPNIVHQAQDVYIEVANRLGNLPMAVQISAHSIKHNPHLTIHDFLQSLQEPYSRLQSLTRGDQDPIRSLDISYQLLDDETKIFGRSLIEKAQHRFTVEEMSHFTKMAVFNIKKYLTKLYHHSFLNVSGPYYQLHPVVYDYLHVKNENNM